MQIENRLEQLDELEDEVTSEDEAQDNESEDASKDESEDNESNDEYEDAHSSEDNEDDLSSSDEEEVTDDATSDEEADFDDSILSSHAATIQTPQQKKTRKAKWNTTIAKALASGKKFDKSYIKRENKRLRNEKERPTLTGTRWTASAEIKYPPNSKVDIASQKFKDGMLSFMLSSMTPYSMQYINRCSLFREA